MTVIECPRCGHGFEADTQDEEAGLDGGRDMPLSTSLRTLDSILAEVGCDRIPDPLRKLTLADLFRLTNG